MAVILVPASEQKPPQPLRGFLKEQRRIQGEIARLQKACREHVFLLAESVRYAETKFDDVLMLRDYYQLGISHHLKIRCLKCGIEKWRDAIHTCPYCLNRMKRGRIRGRGFMSKVFRDIYNRAGPFYSCRKCDFYLLGTAYQPLLVKQETIQNESVSETDTAAL
ncbi:MAG TPA: hypothetical protein VJJ72_02030 [Candidatus Paceibacterota bacterium]